MKTSKSRTFYMYSIQLNLGWIKSSLSIAANKVSLAMTEEVNPKVSFH